MPAGIGHGQAEDRGGPLAVPPPLDPKVIEPMRTLGAKHFPAVPLTPLMLAGATDGSFSARERERVRVSSFYAFRDYLFDLVTTYTGPSAIARSRPPA